MARSISDNRKKPGRPRTTGPGTLVGVRIGDDRLSKIDAWATKQTDAPSRPEAIRRLVELGLSVAKPQTRGAYKSAAKAKAMAGEQIERMIDADAPAEERQQRKRRLLKGPPEFRDVRTDQPKPRR